MKIKNSSRITALILTLVMILPLISLPTFAEEVVSNVIWSEDFENIAVGNYLAKADSGSQAKVKQDGTNKYWELPFFGYDADGNVIKGKVNGEGETDGCSCKNLGTTTNCDCQNINNNFIINNKAVSYSDYDVVVFAADYYIEEDAFGHITSQFRRNVSAIVGTAETETTGIAWVGLFQLDCRTDDVATFTAEGLNTVYYNRTVNKGEWFTLSMAINLDTGSMALYANEVLVFTTTLKGNNKALSNISISADTWIVFKPTNNKGTDLIKYDGATYVDNVAIYTDTTSLGETYLYQNDFERYTAGALASDAYITNLTAAVADGNKVTTKPATIVDADGKKALQIEYLSTNNGTREGVNIDKNLALNVPELSYKNLKSVVFDFNVLIPANSTGMIHIRYGNAKASATGSKNGDTVISETALTDQAVAWTPELFRLTYTATGTTAHISNEQNGDATVGAVPVGKWNTLSAVIDLEAATVTIYVNGTKVSTATIRFQYAYESGKWAILENPSNVTLTANKLNITGHANVRKTDGVGGNLLFDEVSVYEGTAPRMQTPEASNYFRYDFENGYSLSAGTAGSLLSRTGLFASIPGSLQFKKLGDTTALNLTMGADPSYSTEAGSAGYEFVIYGSRVMDITNAYTADDVTYYAKGNSNDRAIKFTKNNDGTIQIIGYAYSGDKLNGVTESVPNGKISNLTNTAESVGALTYATKNEKATIHSSQAMLEVGGIGAKNIDAQVRFNAATFTSGTVVLEAKYYIPTGAKGRSECQDNTSGFKALYVVDLTNAKIANKTVTRDAWHTVTSVVDVANATADVYIDGVFATTAAMCSKGSFNASKWIVAKVMKETTLDAYAGELYVDDVAIEAYEAERVLTVAPEAGKNFIHATFTFNGVTSGKITATGGKYFNAVGSNAAINYTYFDVADYAGIVDTEAEVQVRLAENSGLRFATKIDTELLDALMNDEFVKSAMFGTLIAPERYLGEGVELTVESLTAAGQKKLQVEPTAIDAFYQGYDNDDATTHYVGSIVDILASNIGQNFCARGYVRVELVTGEIVYIYSADYATRNVQEAATAIIAEVGEENLDEVYGVYAQVLRNYAAGLQANPA